MKCKLCGKITIKTRYNKLFCSSKCRGNHWAIHNRNKYYNKKCICKKCGIEYEPNKIKVNHKFCSECSGTIKYKGSHKKELKRLKRYRNTKRGKLTRTFLQLKRQRKIKGLKESFKLHEWINKLKSTKGICPKCGENVGLNKLTKDHTPPITKAPKGFIYTINNVNPLCLSCNSSKGNR